MAEKLTRLRVFSFALLFFVFLLGVVLYFNSGENKELIKAFTEKKRYSASEELKVEIKNNTENKICFSSCYPYFMQTDEGRWGNYAYPQCEKENVVETCIDPSDLKAFAISLNQMFVKPALHRLAIPACVGCALGEEFRVDKILYSNEFEITK
jgi:hypothetical protein